jgi:hypothetical protein
VMHARQLERAMLPPLLCHSRRSNRNKEATNKPKNKAIYSRETQHRPPNTDRGDSPSHIHPHHVSRRLRRAVRQQTRRLWPSRFYLTAVLMLTSASFCLFLMPTTGDFPRWPLTFRGSRGQADSEPQTQLWVGY